MTTALASTQTACHLSLTVTRPDNQLFVLPLVTLTPILLWLWAIWQTASRFYQDLVSLTQAIAELIEALAMVVSVYLTWFGIAASAIRFGVGL